MHPRTASALAQALTGLSTDLVSPSYSLEEVLADLEALDWPPERIRQLATGWPTMAIARARAQ